MRADGRGEACLPPESPANFQALLPRVQEDGLKPQPSGQLSQAPVGPPISWTCEDGATDVLGEAKPE